MRVIDAEGENRGVCTREEALALAQEQGKDLIIISDQVDPPVARITDFDKFRYQHEKQEKEKKKQQAQKGAGEVKHIRFSGRAAENDLKTKIRQVEKFLDHGAKVELMLVLRGREKANKTWAYERLDHFLSLIETEYKVVSPAKKGGRGIVTQIVKK